MNDISELTPYPIWKQAPSERTLFAGFKKSALILRKKSKQTWPVKLLLSMGTATCRKHELQHMSLENCYSTSSVRISIFRDITTLISDTLSCVCGQFFIDQILKPWLGAFKYILPLFQYFDGHCSIFLI